MHTLVGIEPVARLGAGGAGEVWRAQWQGAPVAIKRLHRDHAPAALRREARLVAALDHPNICDVYDLGWFDGQLTMVMALAERGSLAPWRGRLPWPVLAPLLAQMLAGLAHVHARGRLHLDLKPSNVLLGLDGGQVRPWLCDFGLGRPSHDPEVSGGTTPYLAPEIGRGDVGPWTDLYAFGVMAAELLTGARPAVGEPATGPVAIARWLDDLRAPDAARRCPDAATALAGLASVAEVPLGCSLSPASLPAPSAPPAEPDHTELTSLVVEAILGPAPPSPPPRPQRFVRPTRALPPTAGATPPPRASRWAGVGLTAARAPRLLGRGPERAALWAALCAADAGVPQARALLGLEGHGRRRLLDWLVVRARASGAVYGCSARPEGETPGRAFVEGLLASVPGPDRVAHLVGAGPLAETLRGALAGAPTPRGWHAVAEQVLGHLAQQRPVLLALPEPARSPWAAQLARRLTAQPQLRLLVVAVGPLPGATAITVGPLPAPALVALIRERAALASGLAERLAEAAHGSPAFAVACLSAWAESGVLVPSPDGLRLAEGAQPRLPDDLHALWLARLGPLLGEAWPALSARALLGPEGAGPSLNLPQAEALADAGVYEESAAGWRFPVSAARLTLVRHAEERGLAPALHADCAQALSQAPPPRSLALAVRIARHHLAAGAPAAAEAVLLDLAHEPFEPASAHAVEAVLAQLPASPPLAVLAGRAAYALGRNDDAQRALDSVSATTLAPWPSLIYERARVLALLALSAGLPAVFTAALEEMAAHAHTPGQAFQAGLMRARAAVIARDPTVADQVQPLLALPVDRLTRLRGRALRIEALLVAKRIDEAVVEGATVEAEAVASGDPALRFSAANNLGDVYREAGRLDEAAAAYQRALEACGDQFPVGAYPHANLAFLDLSAQRWDAAADRLAATLERLGPTPPARLALLLLGLAQLPLAARHDPAWDAAMDALDAAIAGANDPRFVEIDQCLAWAAEAWQAVDPSRAARAAST